MFGSWNIWFVPFLCPFRIVIEHPLSRFIFLFGQVTLFGWFDLRRTRAPAVLRALVFEASQGHFFDVLIHTCSFFFFLLIYSTENKHFYLFIVPAKPVGESCVDLSSPQALKEQTVAASANECSQIPRLPDPPSHNLRLYVPSPHMSMIKGRSLRNPLKLSGPF